MMLMNDDPNATPATPDPALPILLASRSPRRLELLTAAGFEVEVRVPALDEDAVMREVLGRRRPSQLSFSTSEALVQQLAYAKARAVADQASERVVIGADTAVWLDGQMLGKPRDLVHAQHMLRALAGRSHVVATGVAMLRRTSLGYDEQRFVTSTEVEFYPLDAAQRALMAAYLLTGSPLDKAGAYGIQDQGGLFVRALRGDWGTVVGLPIAELSRRLHAWGIRPRMAAQGEGRG